MKNMQVNNNNVAMSIKQNLPNQKDKMEKQQWFCFFLEKNNNNIYISIYPETNNIKKDPGREIL